MAHFLTTIFGSIYHDREHLVLNVGDSIILNAVTYQYQGVISKSSGEAEIFLISNNGNKCVFKLYYPNFKPKEDILKQLKQLKHEDIINVIDYGYHQERFFEIMDYAEGGTIEKYLPIKDSSRIKQIISEVINAYNFCHSHGVVHRDIKPQNFYFKNADGTDLLIGDFGISTLLETGKSRHLTSQSLTVGYAAPEMYGIGGKAYVGREVDYYALGVTLIHIWDGMSPFEGLGMHAIANLTTSGKVRIPEDMSREMQKLVKGLITVDYTKRWGYEEIQRWLKGEDVPVHFQVKEISYPPYNFGPNETATTAEELADILKKNVDKGKKHLYSGKLSAWLNLFNQGLAVELDRIIEDDYPKDQDAGIQKAIYILNPDEPFMQEIIEGKEGHFQQRRFASRTSGGLAYVLERGSTKYMSELSKPSHPFYLYLESHDAKTEADTFRNYFKTFSSKKALNTIILELRGRDKIKLGEEWYSTPEELLKYKDQQHLVNEFKDKESALSLWLEGSQYQDIKKRVEKWKKLSKQDNVMFAYAVSQKSNPMLNDSLKALTDKYIVPDQLNQGLQSSEQKIFSDAVDKLFYLYDSSLLIEKAKYKSFVDETIVPKELTEGINAQTIAEYMKAATSLNEMMASSSARMSKAEYQFIVAQYKMPLNITNEVNIANYMTRIARIRQLKILARSEYENLKKLFLLPKELMDGLASDDDRVFEHAVKSYDEIKTLMLTVAEYEQVMKEYVIPNEIVNGLQSTRLKEHKAALNTLQTLKETQNILSVEEFNNLVKKYLFPIVNIEELKSKTTEMYKDAVIYSRVWKKCYHLLVNNNSESEITSVATAEIMYTLSKALVSEKKDIALAALKYAINMDCKYYIESQNDESLKTIKSEIDLLLSDLKSDLARKCISQYENLRKTIEEINSIEIKMGRIPYIIAQGNFSSNVIEKELNQIKQISENKNFMEMKNIDKNISNLKYLVNEYIKEIQSNLKFALQQFENEKKTASSKISSLKSKLDGKISSVTGVISAGFGLVIGFILSIKGCQPTFEYIVNSSDDHNMNMLARLFLILLSPIVGIIVFFIILIGVTVALAFLGRYLGRKIEHLFPNLILFRRNKTGQRKAINDCLNQLRSVKI